MVNRLFRARRCSALCWPILTLLIGGTLHAQKIEFDRAYRLATNICAQCHLFPEPTLLDRATWKEKIQPLMRKTMGVTALENDPSANARLLIAEWNAIWNDYYFLAAPEKALPQDHRAPIVPDLVLFKVEDPRYQVTNGYATLVYIDPEAHQIYVGNALTKSLDVLDSNGKLVSSSPVDSTLVHLLKRPQGWIGTQIGFVPPSDMPLGLVSLYDKKENRFEKSSDLLTGLVRPVQTLFADLTEPGREDLLVCSFGNTVGRMSRYTPQTPGKYREQIILDRPGALLSRIIDFDHDGKPDILVLTAQGKEGLFLYHNQGNGDFEERPLIQQPPVWGYVYFELADFNRDGYLDVLTANGDLGDFACPPKKYHGIRIYLNDGKWNFHEAFFYPLNGAFKCMAADFDNDGDLDIAAISFFPDYEKSSEESFVYLQNVSDPAKHDLRFSPHTFPDPARGRWLTMDIGDLDGDGDLDIVLGGAYKVPFRAPDAFLNRWQKEGPSILILRNQSAENSRQRSH
ncbi:MAG TPA: VCBS repeat-containing protein [Candidatus Limnocylindrales bacterium]|nr:VCBS repeat-containing protein [Candidatus Limnocylindrales bacterium]